MQTDHSALRSLPLVVRSAGSFGVKVLGATISFAFYAVVARNLTVQSAGVIFVGIALLSAASAICRIGLDQSIVRRISQKDATDASQVAAELRTAAVLVVLTSLALAALLWSQIDLLAPLLKVSSMERKVLALFLAGIAPMSLSLIMVAILNGSKRNIAATALQTVVPQGVSLILALGWLASTGAGITAEEKAEGFALVYVIGSIVATVAGWVLSRRDFTDASAAKEYSSDNETLRAGLHLYPGALADVAISTMPTLLVSATVGSTEAAMFNIGQRITSLIFFAFVAVNAVAGPHLGAAAKEGRLAPEYKRFTTMTTLAVLPICVLAALSGRWLLALFGGAYEAAAPTLLILLGVQVVHAVFGPVITALVMADLKRQYTVCMILGVGMLLLLPVLSTLYGASGAAMAVLLAVLTQKGAAFYYFIRSPVIRKSSP